MRALIAVFFFGLGGAAQAQDCPDFYRFVDFGLEDDAGRMYRGGPIFRAENFDETPLLIASGTQCLDVYPTLTDGRGNPMPVVSSVQYDPAVAGLDLTDFRLTDVGNAKALAEVTAARHQDWLESSTSLITRGDNYVCAAPDGTGDLSCQLVSPYDGNMPLVVYCNATNCAMLGLAMNERLAISGRWPSQQRYIDDPHTAAIENAQRVQQIFEFLEPLSASN